VVEPAQVIEPAISEIQLPPGIAGPDAVAFDVRSFVLPCPDGILLIDTGPPGATQAIESALRRIGAAWSDVTDVVLTHAHFDHVAALPEVLGQASRATVWAGATEVPDIPVENGWSLRELREGDCVGDLTVLDTPGHTRGHISLLHLEASVLLIGDVVGSVGREVSFGPPAFTADPVLSGHSLERMAGLRPDRVLFSHGPELPDPVNAIYRFLETVKRA
jgi:glyoxylase-like metal-dependent hydrolase (beta-lactamase superfamily II)